MGTWKSLLCLLFAVTVGYCCTTNDDILIDIMFVVDGSGSIGRRNFDLVKSWLANAAETMFHQFGKRAQIGVLQYSDKDPAFMRTPIEKSKMFVIPFGLGKCSTADCMVTKIMDMPYLSSQTYTYYALRRVLEVEFPLSKHAHVAKRAMILLTDGAANDGLYLHSAYEETVRNNVTSFAIGVANYRIRELQVIANGGKSDDRVFVSVDFESLANVIETLEEGLEDEGFFCDECTSGTDNCDPHAECIDTVNGFDCECTPGFYGDGVTCENINDCWPNPCSKNNSHCVDGVDSYTCQCDSGYFDNGYTCEDIDECASNPCKIENSRCDNLLDFYVCDCQEGFKWTKDGLCVERDAPPANLNDIVMVVCFVLVVVAILSLVSTVIIIKRRERVFTPRQHPQQSERLVYQANRPTEEGEIYLRT